MQSHSGVPAGHEFWGDITQPAAAVRKHVASPAEDRMHFRASQPFEPQHPGLSAKHSAQLLPVTQLYVALSGFHGSGSPAPRHRSQATHVEDLISLCSLLTPDSFSLKFMF